MSAPAPPVVYDDPAVKALKDQKFKLVMEVKRLTVLLPTKTKQEDKEKTEREIAGLRCTAAGGVTSSIRSARTDACELRQMSGRNFITEMKRARLATSVFG